MKAQLNTLKRLNAPQDLLFSFIEVCEINEFLPIEMRASTKELLEEQCRKFGFSEILDDGWFFRPYLLGEEFRKHDIACEQIEPLAAEIEQTYRRGYYQGFALSRQMMNEGKTLTQLESRELKIHAWRLRAVQKFGSHPGDSEKPTRNIFGGRRSISAKIRYQVLHRHEFRCVACGATANDGAKLDVDHIIPVSKGGTDEISNLQSLCQQCNVGKSNHIYD